MPNKPTVLVTIRVGKGKTIDPELAKGVEKSMQDAAIKAFKQHDAVKSTRDKEGYEYTIQLKTLSSEGSNLSCEIEGMAHPMGKLKPLMKASNSGKMQGGSARDAGDLVAAVIEGQVKKIEGQLKKLK